MTVFALLFFGARSWIFGWTLVARAAYRIVRPFIGSRGG